jgi:hypothetical protein
MKGNADWAGPENLKNFRNETGLNPPRPPANYFFRTFHSAKPQS